METNEKTAVVTGGGNGVGKALCMELADRGYRVVVVDIALDEAESTTREIEKTGGTAMAIRCDVTSESDVDHLVESAVSEYGLPDLVFSNAGTGMNKSAVDTNMSDLIWLFSLNVFGMWIVAAKFAQKAMQAEKAMRVVVTGSEHSVGVPFGGSAAYSATKHATLAMADAMRIEWVDQPVDISILCLGLTQSRLWEGQRHRRDEKPEINPEAAAVMAAGMPAADVARICLDGVERGDFYIFTHSHIEEYAVKRFQEITEAFAVLNKTAPDFLPRKRWA